MVKIRLARGGKKNDTIFRVIAIDSQLKNQGKALEVLGFWNPRENTSKIDKKRVEAWVSKGAQVTPAVKTLMA